MEPYPPPSSLDLDLDLQDFQFAVSTQASTPEDYQFDCIVQKLQQVLLSPDFSSIQTQFFSSHCSLFEYSQQNKIEYTQIFHKYQGLIEKHLLKELETLDNFSMERFQDLLETRKDQIDEQILDLILSFVDFGEFKALILDAKREKEMEEEKKLGDMFVIRGRQQR